MLLRPTNVSKLVYRCRSEYNYQFLQSSIVPTMHFQKSLPKLPVPKLEDTMSRYLLAQKPLLSTDAYTETEKLCKEFQNGIGKTMHEMVVKDNKYKNNYVSDAWFEMYLKERKPLPLNYNPFLVFNQYPDNAYNNQLIKATNMLISSLRFYRSLKRGNLMPEIYHLKPEKSDKPFFYKLCKMVPPVASWYAAYLFDAYPLDMSQYNSLFHSTRVPKHGKDSFKRNPATKHVSVMKGGNFYVFDVLDHNGEILPADNILAKLKGVLEDPTPPAEFPVGVLTSQDRDIWARARDHLEKIGNAETLDLIDSAIFNISLDDVVIKDDLCLLAKSYLLGDFRNRWFDKSFTLILTKDGYGGLNFEHAWGDGVAVLRYFQDILKDSQEHPQVHPDTPASAAPVRRLEFKLDDASKEFIHNAAHLYTNIERSLAINYLLYDGLCKDVCKKRKVSPDAMMQLGFQCAFYKQYGTFVPTYESCSTAAFKFGRTETIRPCTMDTKAFSLATATAKRPSNEELLKMLRKCSTTHMQLTKNAAMGQGFDRHMFAMRKAAEKSDLKLGIFEDPSYQAINRNILSTSTLSSPAVLAGGFGPTEENGFGIGYVIRDESLGILVTSYPPHRDGQGFVNCLKNAYDDIQGILDACD